MHRLLLLFVLLSFASLSMAIEPQSVADMEKIILGSWSEKLDMEGLITSGVSKYSSDHTVEHIGSIVAFDFKIDFRIRSKWRIEDDTLITEVLETNQPDMIGVGHVERDKILSMTNNNWTYRDSNGTESTAVRLRELSP